MILTDRYNQRYSVATMSGNHDKQWMEVVILVNMDNKYFVMFEAETGTSKHTYIAIDDVSFTLVSVNISLGCCRENGFAFVSARSLF